MNLGTDWKRFRDLAPADRSMAIDALLLLLLVRVGLRVLPFTRVRRLLERRAGSGDGPVRSIAWAVNAVSRRVPRTTCLAEALVMYTLLRRHGHSPALRIGVRRADSSPLQAHAWVECDGDVVIGAVDSLADHAVLS
jgi:hypothetical protein